MSSFPRLLTRQAYGQIVDLSSTEWVLSLLVKSTTSQNGLSDAEGPAWAGFLRAHDLVTQKLDAELRASCDLALSEFEILLHLAWAGGERRMAQIAHDVVLTGGGVTRIVARLEKLGFITKRTCDDDGRGILAVLTEKGWAKQRSAQKVHLEGVRTHFLQEASMADLAALSRFFGRVVAKARGAKSKDEACALDEKKRSRATRKG